MGWAALAGLASGLFSSWGSGSINQAAGQAQSIIDNANTYSQNTINNANADATNQVRKANNGFAAAQASLSNLTRSLRNNSQLDAAASQADSITENIARLTDAATQGSLDTQLRSAEQLGAVRASAAAAGVGGTTASMLQKTMQLTAARAQTQTDQRTSYQTYDMLAQRSGLLRSAVASLDEGQSFAPIDYNTSVAPLVQSPIRASQYSGSVFGSALLGTIASKTGLISNLFGSSGTSGASSGSGYSAGSLLSGVTGAVSSALKDFGSLGGGTNGFFSTGSSSGIANYLLK